MARHIDLNASSDIIVAPATGSGAAAIAIVRMTGKDCRTIAQDIFSGDLNPRDPGRLVLGYLKDEDGQPIDQALAAHWIEPRSYTGEDMVEFHLHGSPALVRQAIHACVAAGARMALPGEFTRRAFLNGKLDLTQAEAVAALTSSKTEDAGRVALRQLSGGLAKQLYGLRKDLIQVTAELEASVDYPEEGIPDATKDRLLFLVNKSRTAIDNLVGSYTRGRRLVQGASVVLAGTPNAGKSSLFNAILKKERAIVTPHAGTTRDTIEATIDLSGIPVTLIDTAGLRETSEEIEAVGIERSRELIKAADLALYVVDSQSPLEDAVQEYDQLADLPHLLVFNKVDDELSETELSAFTQQFTSPKQFGVYTVSALKKTGIDTLEEALVTRLGGGHAESGSDVMVTSERHARCLYDANEALGTALEGIASELSPEFIIIDLTIALSQIDEITGKRELDEEVLDAIFSTFCLGK